MPLTKAFSVSSVACLLLAPKDLIAGAALSLGDVMHDRFKVMGCWINRVCMDKAITCVREHAAGKVGGYVCFSNVHSIVTAKKDGLLREAINNSFMSMPDGMPVAALAGLCRIEGVSRVAGPDFMPAFLSETWNARHYFYGSTADTLKLLVVAMKNAVPTLNIVGYFSPPFGEISDEDHEVIISDINNQKPDYIWVGLGAPKQEYWMAKNWDRLRPAILLGVGAAFDFHAGTKPRAPRLIRQAGLEWLHRLLSEPRRLWRRYLYTNSIFIFYAARVLLRGCKRLR